MQITLNRAGGRKLKVIAQSVGSGRSSGWSQKPGHEPLFEIGLTSHDKDGFSEYYTVNYTRSEAEWAIDSLKKAMEQYDEQAKGN